MALQWFGYAAGQALPMYGIGGAAAGPLAKALKDPYVREAAIGAVTNAAPTVVSGVAQGKPAGQIALETANNAGTGAYYGLGFRYLGEILPQPGTIAYRELESRGGWRRTAAPLVGRMAQVLNPEGAAAADEFGLGNYEDPSYNTFGGRYDNGGVLNNANYAQRDYSAKSFSKEGIKIYSSAAGRTIKNVDDLSQATKNGDIEVSQIPLTIL